MVLSNSSKDTAYVQFYFITDAYSAALQTFPNSWKTLWRIQGIATLRCTLSVWY